MVRGWLDILCKVSRMPSPSELWDMMLRVNLRVVYMLLFGNSHFPPACSLVHLSFNMHCLTLFLPETFIRHYA